MLNVYLFVLVFIVHALKWKKHSWIIGFFLLLRFKIFYCALVLKILLRLKN